ncbi:DUF4153 domain-containing protein [Emticicia fluvialis]|uniref:DUF4153 domain-containing protein n=1 Tax=Emticicia fluvialis TaxID=2974474 RepID=UPI002165483F|nr:DUF4173 domain-containing protein [Emticicia fluvialis]
MNQLSFRLLSVVILTIVFNYFFWLEKFGINLLHFNTSLIALLALYNKIKFDTIPLRVALGTVLLTGAMVIVYNSVLSILVHLLCFLVLTGFIHRRELTSVGGALWQYGLNLLMTTFEPLLLLAETKNKLNNKNQLLGKSVSIAQLLLIPIIAFAVFLLIFKSANPIFSDIVTTPFAWLFEAMERFFTDFSIGHFIFLLFGAGFIFSVLFNWGRVNNLYQIKQRPGTIATPEKPNEKSAINEYSTALLLIVSVNILLLIINIIDIKFLWFNLGADLKSAHELSKLVHEGTYLLILSIVLSIFILIYYFRNELNFLPGNRWLVVASYVWIIQNGFLIISVLLRNYEYITNYGLAHGRIVVIFLLLITTIGLILLWLKIKHKYTILHSFKQACWGLLLSLVSFTLFDWDSMIVQYNLSTQKAADIDYYYLNTLSDRTLPLLYENRSKIEESSRIHNHFNKLYDTDRLNIRISYYLKKQKGYNWVSWDLSNSKAVNYFKDKKIEIPNKQPGSNTPESAY